MIIRFYKNKQNSTKWVKMPYVLGSRLQSTKRGDAVFGVAKKTYFDIPITTGQHLGIVEPNMEGS